MRLLLSLMLISAGCASPERLPQGGGVEGGPDREAFGVALHLADAGLPRVFVEAPYMGTYQRDSLWYVLARDSVQRVTITLYDALGVENARLVADSVHYTERNRIFRAFGEVEVVTREGRTLYTDQLTWEEMSYEIRAPGNVRLVSATERVEGEGLVTNEALTQYRLRRITANVYVEE
jgi:hypothetical protein